MGRVITIIGIIVAILLIGCEPLALKSTIMELSDPPTWELSQAPLIPAEAGDKFGQSVNISENYLIIGAPSHNQATDGGAAYIYSKNSAGNWQFQITIKSAAATSGQNFGTAVAISDNYAVVGSSGGATHKIDIFERIGSSWDWKAEFAPGTNNYGETVDVSGDFIAVGAWGSGFAYVYYRNAGTWEVDGTLPGSQLDQFGTSVSISGNNLVVSAPMYSGTEPAGGAAYVYERSGGAWVSPDTLEPQTPQLAEFFGQSVAIDGTSIVVGAPETSTAYFFELEGSTWSFHSAKSITGVVPGDHFGWSVSISDRVAICGAYGTPDTGDKGCVYVFEKYGEDWIYRPPALAYSKSENGDSFGYAVAVSGTNAVIGAYRDDILGSDDGSGFIFKRK